MAATVADALHALDEARFSSTSFSLVTLVALGRQRSSRFNTPFPLLILPPPSPPSPSLSLSPPLTYLYGVAGVFQFRERSRYWDGAAIRADGTLWARGECCLPHSQASSLVVRGRAALLSAG